MTLLRLLVWAAFLGDVLFLVGYAVLPPRSWHRHPMGWHLVAWSLAFGILTGMSVFQSFIGPLPVWAADTEVGFIVTVIWWRTTWSLYLKFVEPRRRVSSGDEGGTHVNHDRLHDQPVNRRAERS